MLTCLDSAHKRFVIFFFQSCQLDNSFSREVLHAMWCFFNHGWVTPLCIVVVLSHTSAVIQPQKNTAEKMGKCGKQMIGNNMWVMFSLELKCDSSLDGAQWVPRTNWKRVQYVKPLFFFLDSYYYVLALCLHNEAMICCGCCQRWFFVSLHPLVISWWIHKILSQAETAEDAG